MKHRMSRGARPGRRRAWALASATVLVLVVAGVFVVTMASSLGTPHAPANASRGSSSSHSGSRSSHPGSAGALKLSTTTPATGAQGVASNATISLTFSAPLSAATLQTAPPALSPAVAGSWIQSSRTTLSYELQSPLVPSTQVSVTVPGGPAGIHAADGGTLAASQTVTFTVAPGDTLRLQQLLAGLDYMPVAFTASGPAPARADLAQDQPGAFSWRWPGLPTELTSLWTQGSEDMITKAAVESFQTQNGLAVDGIAGPAVWTALINDTINAKVSSTPYVYVLVNKALPENLTLWNNGAAQLTGIPVNTGVHGADTADGTFTVFEHVRYSEMKGTNPDGTTYDDPNVPYASYFNGGDALHGFIRGSYGSPQSNGCVEMTYADASQVWPLTPIGTLVTVEGPTY
jgi:peptidoglycan hydrolase-like protein with peptidoglycan-binding domain